MNRFMSSVLLFIISAVSSMGIAQEGVAKIDLEKERIAILDLDKKWAAAAEGRDVELIVSFWSDDAVVYAPGLPPVVGKNAIREFVRQSHTVPGFSIRWSTTDVQVSGDGTFAYATGINQTTYNDPDGKLITVRGKAVTVWQKDSFGIWKCVVDIWNDTPSNDKQ